MHLTVSNPFNLNGRLLERGHVITDQDEIASVNKTHPHHVIQHHDHPDDFFKTDEELAAAKNPPVEANPED